MFVSATWIESCIIFIHIFIFTWFLVIQLAFPVKQIFHLFASLLFTSSIYVQNNHHTEYYQQYDNCGNCNCINYRDMRTSINLSYRTLSQGKSNPRGVLWSIKGNIIILQESVSENPIVEFLKILANDSQMTCVFVVRTINLIEQIWFGRHVKISLLRSLAKTELERFHIFYDFTTFSLKITPVECCANQWCMRICFLKIIRKLLEIR